MGELPVTYDNQNAVLAFDSEAKVLAILNASDRTPIVSANVTPTSPRPAMDGANIQWGALRLQIADGQEEAAARLVSYINDQGGPPLSSPLTSGSVRPRSVGTSPSQTRSSPTPSSTFAGHSAERRATAAARFVEICAYVFIAVGVVSGVLMASSTDSRCDSGLTSDCSWIEEHPLFWIGFVVAMAAAFQGAVVVMLAAYIQARTAHRD